MKIQEAVNIWDDHYRRHKPKYKYLVRPVLWILLVYGLAAVSVYLVNEFLKML